MALRVRRTNQGDIALIIESPDPKDPGEYVARTMKPAEAQRLRDDLTRALAEGPPVPIETGRTGGW